MLCKGLPSGLGAHAALTESARTEAEFAWNSAGGESLLEGGRKTHEYHTHHQMFVEVFVDKCLRNAHCNLDGGKRGVTDSNMRTACLAQGEGLWRPSVGGVDAETPDQRAEARLVAERATPGRPQKEICSATDDAPIPQGFLWELEPCIDMPVTGYKGRRTPPLLMRRVVDGFCSVQQCQDLCGHAIRTMETMPAVQGQTAVAAGPWLGEAGSLVGGVVERVRARLASDFGLGGVPLFFAGAVLTRIAPDEMVSGGLYHGDGSPYQPHVDRARVPFDDYAAILYLCTQDEHFSGGGLAFMDAAADCWVAPRRGRLVSFTAGPENLHRVDRVTSGLRFALSMWFTLAENHSVRPLATEGLEILLQGGAARLVPAKGSLLSTVPSFEAASPLPEVYDLVHDDGDDRRDVYDCVD